ncbi:DUF881 domain-containing protein [Herbivorax sp. ANBcel31]|uniref:DUF881 domain-containing protein n=1 Tax=Herbivorax sp. ANBcel31 TaxID=3069754 RepID=UPI0027B30CCB|nr:DUF881 domain-containing protein [Herbivorax sp. ANBcel31]MDQ2085975.1 DUF881 domain-containing protein [Herbivorax sp. ANBcel31]
MIKFTRILVMTIICFLIGTMVSWQYKSIDNNNRSTSSQRTNIYTLQEELIEEKRINENLKERLEEIKKDTNDYIYAKDDIQKIDETIRREMKNAQILAGLVDVKGEGVVITIDPIYRYMSESDFLNVINQLRAWEAQAISINGERITVLTEIEAVEDNVYKINGNYHEGTYIIKAILPPNNIDYLIYAIELIFETGWRRGSFEVEFERKEDIIIPKISGEDPLLKYVY